MYNLYEKIMERLKAKVEKMKKAKADKENVDSVLGRIAIIEKHEILINMFRVDDNMVSFIAQMEADRVSIEGLGRRYGSNVTIELSVINLEIMKSVIRQQAPITDEKLEAFRGFLKHKRIADFYGEVVHNMLYNTLHEVEDGFVARQETLYDAICYCVGLLMREGLDTFEAEREVYKLVGIE